jgi:FMN phosphatase YigB (HAD superfamily)
MLGGRYFSTLVEMDLRGVLFDFGNTLFAHTPLPVTIGKCARRLGVPMSDEQASDLADRIDAASMTPDELAHVRDLDAEVWARRWKVLYAIADEWAERLGDAINTDMHDPLAWVPYTRSGETLRRLHDEGVLVGVVSNTGWDVRAVFTAHSMSQYVDSFTLSYEAGAVKPDHGIFDAACASLGLDAGEVLMVGDDPRADSGAVLAGIRTLLLPARLAHTDNGVAAVLDMVGNDR